MKTKRNILRRVAFVAFVALLFVNCEKEELVQDDTEVLTPVEHKAHWPPKKIKICYTNRHGHSRIIKVSKWAWRWFKKRGAVRLDDRDGDGYVPDNACRYGQMGDCDDTNPEVNPGVPGSCGAEIDSDGDGVPDDLDTCPDEAGLPELEGCPDADGDGIADKDDLCPTVAGLAALSGCPDADGDGVTDADDECPNEAGPASNNGCPLPDSDNDGVLDRDDDCPDEPGLPEFNGCPEADG